MGASSLAVAPLSFDFDLDFGADGAVSLGGEVVLLAYLGTNPDDFSGANFVGVATGHKFASCFDGEFAGTVGAIALTPSEVPLTASGMLLIGALGMTALARRKRSLWIRNLRLK